MQEVTLHDGSYIRLKKLDDNFDTSNRAAALQYIQEHQEKGEIVTGLLHLNPESTDLHQNLSTCDKPLNELHEEELCPGEEVLALINKSMR